MLRQAYRVSEAIASPIYKQVTERIVRQLLESLLYEQIVMARQEKEGEKIVFRIDGKDAYGKMVTYSCTGRRAYTFGRIRLERDSVTRSVNHAVNQDLQPGQVLFELLPGRGEGDGCGNLRAMADELEQTRLKDVLAQYERAKRFLPLKGLSFDELEREIMDGHPYHPCYKSRMGFQYEDNYAYGPEYKQELHPLWVAINKTIAKSAIISGASFEQLLVDELGEEQMAAFRERLVQAGCDPLQYIWLPVHPWQWRNKIVPAFISELHDKQIVLLGSGTDAYMAQQSIRTLSNASHPGKASVKLSLHIRNTSSVRSLTPHSVVSAPAVSEWLSRIVEADSYFKKEARVIILKEFAGVTFQADAEAESRDPREIERYGALGTIWRESVHKYLAADEQAVPFHALYALESDGTPFIDPWIQRVGITAWLERLLEAAMLPVVHLLIMHGIALESHAQNMILVHQNGLPARVALKDFHEGVEYCEAGVSAIVSPPPFREIHPVYAQGKLDDYYEMKECSSLVAMTLDALFMINLGELALLLHDRYSYREEDFWKLAVKVLSAHQKQYQGQCERFKLFDLYVASCPVEQLANSRLQSEATEFCHMVENPLHLAMEERVREERMALGEKKKREELHSYASGQSK
ncbi:siderophore synthetase component [Paenibacillus endophyticus]|uniref:Siderophore synthetase component n=1 Tax=Paenibacillus endophyticus TaxID=1294268 RepID=A0A7W5GDD4_9BACL|nr:IucA/IucC family protein [Paenibacillus endophyticus]MBB3154917.1 siderophore synthetase component [Paenibacillus endophyticus]